MTLTAATRTGTRLVCTFPSPTMTFPCQITALRRQSISGVSR